MINNSEVQKQFINLLSDNYDEKEDYSKFIDGAIAYVSEILIDDEFCDDVRLIHLCACKAFYTACLAFDFGADVKSFKAGDVTVESGTSLLDRAKMLLEAALSDCTGIVKKQAFNFRAV